MMDGMRYGAPLIFDKRQPITAISECFSNLVCLKYIGTEEGVMEGPRRMVSARKIR